MRGIIQKLTIKKFGYLCEGITELTIIFYTYVTLAFGLTTPVTLYKLL